ncbi:inositol 1,4,5-trisphosphate receptor-interacting protein-like 1 [Phalacrocorax carbo]|uniref:inositol 1,4,5-trisphosphate receptor-interacting protein-like 1 n=1 Tax=Phalacrocorax carbo TaxID=9209 RepID=UPI00311958BD
MSEPAKGLQACPTTWVEVVGQAFVLAHSAPDFQALRERLALAAMAATEFLIRVLLGTIWYPQKVGDELDEATRERMQQRAQLLSLEMSRLLQELKQSSQRQRSQVQTSQEPSVMTWGALLFAALQQRQFWAIAGVLVLLFGLWWWLSRRSHETDTCSKKGSCRKKGHRQEQEGKPSVALDMGRILAERLLDVPESFVMVEELVDELLRTCRRLCRNSFMPRLMPAIGEGSFCQGWSPREDDAVYRLLVPLQAPRGHAFHLELGTDEEMPARNSRLRVELVCTCMRERLVKDLLCFLHHSEEELRRNQDPSLLDTLCTGSYLDVQKTAHWFQQFVRSAWMLMPLSGRYNMKVLPSSRSCKLQLTNASRRTLFIEITLGVQQGDSDIFLSSQSTEDILTPSTTWLESYTVAEMKFFRHIARQVPRDSFHLKCLQLCARAMVGTGFSTYTLKTAVMHLLTTIPLSGWRRRDFLLRLQDIMRYLRCCLEEKRLDHFFFGNENMPQEIVLPPALQAAEPPNLFQHLAQDPAAHAEALHDFYELEDRLTRLLFYGN